MGLIPPAEKELEMPEINQKLWASMEKFLNERMYTFYMLGKPEKQNIRRGFLLGLAFARARRKK